MTNMFNWFTANNLILKKLIIYYNLNKETIFISLKKRWGIPIAIFNLAGVPEAFEIFRRIVDNFPVNIHDGSRGKYTK